MTISPITIKFLGQKITTFRVVRNGDVVKVCATWEDAAAWVASNG